MTRKEDEENIQIIEKNTQKVYIYKKSIKKRGVVI